MVSQPSLTFWVKDTGEKPSRPIALNVAPSVNFWSPAYSIRTSVGERTSNRAAPERTSCRVALCRAAEAGGATPTASTPANAAPSATAFVLHDRAVLIQRLRCLKLLN